MKRLPAILLFLTILLLSCEMSAQCAMCKEAAESTMKDDPTSMARNLNSGILYLMAVPYLAIAFIFRKQLYQVLKRVSSRFLNRAT